MSASPSAAVLRACSALAALALVAAAAPPLMASPRGASLDTRLPPEIRPSPAVTLSDDSEVVAGGFLRAARATVGFEAGAAAADGSVEVSTPAGDLDGDQRPDVISLHAIPRTDFDPDLSLRYSHGYVFTLKARRGTTGAQVWTYTEKAAVLGAVPLDLGTEDGVLVVSYEINYTNGAVVYPYAFTMRLTALGSDGAVVWQEVLGGPMVHVNFVGAGGAALPLFRGLLDAVEGDADDVLVDSVEFFRSGGQGQHPVRLTATVLDGTDGLPASAASRVVTNADYYLEPFAIAAPDLDADGLDDCLFVIQRSVDAPAALTATRGSDGAELWTTAAVQFGGSVSIVPAGDATGDGTTDLIANTFAAPGTAGVHLLSGRTGSTLWSRSGGAGYLLGDADADGRADAGILTYVTDGEFIGVRLEAITGSGNVLHEETHRLHGIGGAQSLAGSVDFLGDVEPDGARDVAVHLGATFVDAPARALDVLASGATGRALRLLDRELPLGGVVTAGGHDLLRRSFPASGGVSLEVVDGLTGSQAWGSTVAEGLSVTEVVIAPANLSGDGADELLVNAMGAFGTRLFALASSDGSPRWTI
jgi:hypothetical protein